MKTIPPRPERESVVHDAVHVFLYDNALDWNADDLCESSCEDGWDLMEELAGKYWDFKREDLDVLDNLCSAVDAALRNAEKRWAYENDVYSKALDFPIQIKQGWIVGVSDYAAATYEVAVPKLGATTLLLIKFEDAVPVANQSGELT